MNLQMQIQIKFSENYDDQLALAQAGGMIVFPNNKPPMFRFDNEAQRVRYEQFRKMNKKEKVSVDEPKL